MKYIRRGSFRRLFSMRRRSFVEEEEATGAKDPSAAADGGSIEKYINDGQRQIETDLSISAVSGRTEECGGPSPRLPIFKCFSFEEIFAATDGFSSENLVGKGGYAEVYKGVVELDMDSSGRNPWEEEEHRNNTTRGGTRRRLVVAVKKLTKTSSEERREMEFLNEIGAMGHVCHPNVSSLLGCCIENGLYLLFQFSPGGSVASRLHDERLAALEWSTRLKIAIGTARGLNYLHKGCKRRIIHRDIKASNILLNHDFQPQISDFGLAKWLPTQWTHHSIAPIEGTVGYLAPEYFSHGIVNEETDVFAFGVFLLELISGKKPVDSSYQSLRAWAKPHLKQGDICKLVDSRLGSVFDLSELARMAFAASLCIRASSSCRPNMAQVLEILTGEAEINKEGWEMPEEDEKEEELWGFEDLESDCDTDDTSVGTSPRDDSVSTIGASN